MLVISSQSKNLLCRHQGRSKKQSLKMAPEFGSSPRHIRRWVGECNAGDGPKDKQDVALFFAGAHYSRNSLYTIPRDRGRWPIARLPTEGLVVLAAIPPGRIAGGGCGSCMRMVWVTACRWAMGIKKSSPEMSDDREFCDFRNL
jgi:hypothetical protein